MSGIKRYNRKIGIARCPGELPLRRVEVAAAIRFGMGNLRAMLCYAVLRLCSTVHWHICQILFV